MAEFGQPTWNGVLAWATARGALTAPTAKNASRYCRVEDRRRSPVARLFGCYGPGGPILDLQTRRDAGDRSLPTGWRPWPAVTGNPPLDNDT